MERCVTVKSNGGVTVTVGNGNGMYIVTVGNSTVVKGSSGGWDDFN